MCLEGSSTNRASSHSRQRLRLGSSRTAKNPFNLAPGSCPVHLRRIGRKRTAPLVTLLGRHLRLDFEFRHWYLLENVLGIVKRIRQTTHCCWGNVVPLTGVASPRCLRRMTFRETVFANRFHSAPGFGVCRLHHHGAYVAKLWNAMQLMFPT